jgi:uncharacterized Zn-binding protein involved in type VI secretion
MPALAALGDAHAHGGAIAGGCSPDTFVNGRPVALASASLLPCPIHGMGCDPKGAARTFCNGLPVALMGDPTTCGSAICSGSPNVSVEG